jgi:hypothetical protein
VAVGFLSTAFAMTQGEFQPGTRRGLASLIAALLLLAALFLSGISFTHINLPPGT